MHVTVRKSCFSLNDGTVQINADLTDYCTAALLWNWVNVIMSLEVNALLGGFVHVVRGLEWHSLRRTMNERMKVSLVYAAGTDTMMHFA